MTTLEVYQATVGSFISKARHIKTKNVVIRLNEFFLSNEHTQFLRTFELLCIILILSCNLNMPFLKVTKVLVDVESNLKIKSI